MLRGIAAVFRKVLNDFDTGESNNSLPSYKRPAWVLRRHSAV